MLQNNNRKRIFTAPAIFLLSSDSIEAKNELDDFVESLYEQLSRIVSSWKKKGYHFEKTIKRIIKQSKLNQSVEASTNLYSSKLLEVSLQLTKKALETNKLLESLLINIEAKQENESLNLIDLTERRSHSVHRYTAQSHVMQTSAFNFLDNIITIENLLQNQLVAIKSDDSMPKDAKINKEFECFMEKINKLLIDERKSFIIDMCMSAFGFIRVASKIIQTDDSKPPNDDTSPIQLSHKVKFIKFSSDPVSREPIVNDFNKNIISLRLSRILDVQSALMLNYANDSFKCQKCAAFLNSFTEFKNESNKNSWICVLCDEINYQEEATKPAHFDIEYLKDDTASQNRLVVFCIDISSSMLGQRADTIKLNCIKTMASFKRGNPNLKISLITFASTANYHGDASLDEPIQIKELGSNCDFFFYFKFKKVEL